LNVSTQEENSVPTISTEVATCSNDSNQASTEETNNNNSVATTEMQTQSTPAEALQNGAQPDTQVTAQPEGNTETCPPPRKSWYTASSSSSFYVFVLTYLLQGRYCCFKCNTFELPTATTF
jgi:hypothetical protein